MRSTSRALNDSVSESRKTSVEVTTLTGTSALFLACKRHLFAFSPRRRIRGDAGHEALRADPGVDLEVRRGHDVLFFLRLRVVEERLLALFELELARTPSSSSRNESANLSTSVVFLPLARAEPRFEPRFLWPVGFANSGGVVFVD
jgi:hypothetical protein